MNELATGDFNLDGKQDVAVGGSTAFPNAVAVLLGNGDGTFQPSAFVAAGKAFSLAVADLNRDGRPDLVIGRDTPNLSVLLGRGDGTFDSAGDFPTFTEFAVTDLALVDLNRDAIIDAVVAGGSYEIGVLHGTGDGSLSPFVRVPAGGVDPTVIEAVDVNGDAHVDVIAATMTSNAVSVLAGNSTSGLTAQWACAATHDCATINFSVGTSPKALAVADFNHDLKPDVVTGNGAPDGISILINTSP